jgi:hypothetical protein
MFVVTCLMAAFIVTPWTGAFAGERGIAPFTDQSQSLSDGTISRSALALVPGESRMMMRQTVASSTESKLLFGLIAGAAIVAGLTMAAYGATASCKGRFGNSTAGCDRLATIGAVTVGGGAAALTLWALSR